MYRLFFYTVLFTPLIHYLKKMYGLLKSYVWKRKQKIVQAQVLYDPESGFDFFLFLFRIWINLVSQHLHDGIIESLLFLSLALTICSGAVSLPRDHARDDLRFWPPNAGRPVVRSRSRHDCSFIRGTSFIAGKKVPARLFPPFSWECFVVLCIPSFIHILGFCIFLECHFKFSF